MAHSIEEMRRPVRRRLKKVVQKSADPLYARRSLALLHLYENGNNVTAAAEEVCAARSSVHKWRSLYELYGEEGLKPQRRGRERWKTDEPALEELAAILEREPGDFGYLRSRWSSELLAVVLSDECGIEVHPTTIRRWLRELDYRWRRARPTLHKRDPRKLQRLRAIEQALRDNRRGTEVFPVDEVDIDLNPKIGFSWQPRGQQSAIPTPGKNRKRYLAGALHAHSGRVVFSEGERKNSDLFLDLLELLRRTWRAARRIVLILDNYRIHSSRITRAWLAANPKFELLFQPAYHPWVNAIERLWKQLHETITRNHLYATMPALMTAVRRFMDICQPFPGNQHGLATA